MAFDFKTFGATESTAITPTTTNPLTPKKTTGAFDFNSFGSGVTTPAKVVSPIVAADKASAETYGATFPAVTGEGIGTAGLKATGNVPSSLYGLTKTLVTPSTYTGIGKLVGNPIGTLLGYGMTAAKEKLGLVPKGSTAYYDLSQPEVVQLGKALNERYGTSFGEKNFNLDETLQTLQRTATNDPFGLGADILSMLEGGATLTDIAKGTTGADIAKQAAIAQAESFKSGVSPIKTMPQTGLGETQALLNQQLSKTAGLVTKPVGAVVGGTGDIISKTTGFGVSQATGLNPETIKNIIAKPGEFTSEALKTTTREDVAGTVKTAIDKRLEDLRSTGSGYEQIRQQPNIVEIKPVPTEIKGVVKELSPVEAVLEKNNIKLVDGKIKTTSESIPLSPADKTALEDFISTYGNEKQLSSNAFLNTRSALSDLAKYDAAKTGNLQKISRELRSSYDALGKEQIPGLKELDAAYAPEKTILRQIQKDYLTKEGAFKDGAVNKIANLTGVGKEQVLGRLEQIVPGVGQRVKILKAAEDIERASGLKVGTYARGILSGGSLLTGNVPGIIAAIMASPEVAVKLLRAYGYTKQTAGPIIQALYKMGNDVNNFRLPEPINAAVDDYLKNPKLGMSMQDVSGSLKQLPGESEVQYYDRLSNINKEAGRLDSNLPTGQSIVKPTRTITEVKIPSELQPYKTQIDFLAKQMANRNIGVASVDIGAAKQGIIKDLNNFIVSSEPKFVAEDIQNYFKSKSQKMQSIKPTVNVVEKNKVIQNEIQNFKRDPTLTGNDVKVQEAAIKKYVENKPKIIEQYIKDNKNQNGSIVVNADNAKKMLKDVGYNGTNAPAVHEVSSQIAKDVFKKALRDTPKKEIGIYSGGGGAGKTTAIEGLIDTNKFGVILDGTFSKIDSGKKYLQQAADAGKNTQVIHVYRDIKDAWAGVIDRMLNNPDEMGRSVPLKQFIDGHIGSDNSVKQLIKEQLGGSKLVDSFHIIDNSLGYKKQNWMPLDKFYNIKYNKAEIYNELLDITKKLKQDGKITAEQYNSIIK